MTSPPLFISFGPELMWTLLAVGILWLLFVALQLTVGIAAIHAFMRGQIGRGVIWGLMCFGLTTAEPLYRWVDTYRGEQAMQKARILKDLPDFTGKSVVYVPSRQLDDVSLDCVDLVQMSGAKTVYLAEPWYREAVAPSEEVPFAAPDDVVDLRTYTKGVARIETRDYGDICVFEPAAPPDRLDYILIQNRFEDLSVITSAHLARTETQDRFTRLRFLVAPVPDITAFQMSTDTANLALFRTLRVGGRWPYSPLRQLYRSEVPRDHEAFIEPLRQIVCREPADAPEATCWPFH